MSSFIDGMGSGYTSMEKAFVRSETNANFFFDLLSQESGFTDASLDGAQAKDMAGGPGASSTPAKTEKDNKIQGREVIAAAFNKITQYYPKITEHFKNLGLDLAAMLGPDGNVKPEFITAVRKRLMGEVSAAKTKSLDVLAAQFVVAEQNGVSNRDPVFLEKWEAFSKLPEADRKAQVKTFLDKPENSAKFVRWAFRLSELSLLPFKDQVDILKEWGIGEAASKAALVPLWQDRGLPKMVAQAALLRGLDLEEEAKTLADDAAKVKQGEARLLFRAAAELDNENPLARRRLAIYLLREGKLSSAGFHIGVAIQNETELRYILENIAGLQKQDARIFAPAPDAYSFAAEQLIQAKRFSDAAQVYSEAAKVAQSRGDNSANTAFIEKKLAAEELAKPFEVLFTDKDNPVAARLYQALRSQGIPTSQMEGALTKDHKIGAKEVLNYLDQNWGQPRVRKALAALQFPALPWEIPGAKLPYDDEAFRKLDFSGKMVAWHLYDIAELNKQEPVDWKEVARHQRLASFYDPDNSTRTSDLGDTLLKLKDYPAAAASFEKAFSDGGFKDLGLKTKAGMAYFGAGDFEKSRAAYTAVLEKSPKDPQALALRHEASKTLLATLEEAKDPKKYKELSASVGADYAMLLTVKPEDEKAKIKDIEKALEGLRGNNGDKAKAVAKLAGLKDVEQAGGITKREVIAAVEGLAQNYLQLAEQSYSDPKDVEAVRSAMNGLAGETFAVLARFAKTDSDFEIQKMAPIYESYQLIADGKLDEAMEKLKSVEKMPEAARVLSTLKKGKLRLYNEAALQVWETYNTDLEQAELSESKGWVSGIGKSSSDVVAKYKLEKELTDAVRLKIETGEAFTLKEALTQISNEGAENLRERAKFLISPSAMAKDQSAIGDVIDLVADLPPIMERSQRILDKAWRLETASRGLQGALGLYGLVEAAAEEDFMKARAKKGLDALQGNASFGRSVEKFIGNFNGAGNTFVDIGFMFVAAGLGNLVKLRMLAKLEQAGVSGYKALVIAGGVSLTAESTALWGLNTLKEAAMSDPSKVFTAGHLAKSYGATLIMIGSLKGFNKVGQIVGPKAAKSLNLMQAGTQLSKGGKAMVWGFGHSFGLGGMIASSHVNQGLNLTPKPIGGWKEGLVHEVLGYVQFAVAHGAADRLVGNKMQEVSMRQHGEIAYKESVLLAKGHADAMGFKAETIKITVEEDGKLKVDGKPLEELDAELKSTVEAQLVKGKDGSIKDQSLSIDGTSRRLLVNLMTDAGLNRPGFSGLWLRQLMQSKKFAESNAYLEKYSIPLRFGKEGQVIAMGSQPGSPHALLGIVSEGGKVESITDEQIKDLTPTPIAKSKPKRKTKARKEAPDTKGEDSPLVAARKALPPGKPDSATPPPPPSGRRKPPPLPLPPARSSLAGTAWSEAYAHSAEAAFAGKEAMFKDGFYALERRMASDPRFQDPKFCAAMEKSFQTTLEALRPILDKTANPEARLYLGQALFVNVMQGKLTLADAHQLAAGMEAGHYRVEKVAGNEYRCVPLIHGAAVKPGSSLLVGKSGAETRAIQGQGLVHETLPNKLNVNFEFRQQGGKTTAIFEGRPGEAVVEVYDPKSDAFRPLNPNEKVEVRDGEVVHLAGEPYVFRAAESVAKELKAREELLQERDELFHSRGQLRQLLHGSPQWKVDSLKVQKRAKAFNQLLAESARNADGSSAIESELLTLASGQTPFAPAARKALKGEFKPAEYRQAQSEIAKPIVESHRGAMEEVEAWLGGLFADELIEHRLTTQLNDPSGKLIDNPHVRLKDPSDVALKIARRGWSSMEPMTDYAGARIVVKNSNDAMVVAAEVEKRLAVRDAYDGKGLQEIDIIGQEYVGGKETMEVNIRKDKDHPDRLLIGSKSGYRALHIVVEFEGKPVEIQIQTESIFKWGKIQHALIYKNENLPPETFKQLNDYCRDVANYLTALEEGPGNPGQARPAQPVLAEGLPGFLKKDIERDLTKMSELMDHYFQVSQDESQSKTRVMPRSKLEGAPKPLSDEDVTRRMPVPPPAGDKGPDKSGVPERRGAAGGVKAPELTSWSDTKPPLTAPKPAELHFHTGHVWTMPAEAKVVMLGTKAGAGLQLKGKNIAAEHAEITRDAQGRCWLRPLHGNSVKVQRNGTWIDLSRDGKAEAHELTADAKVRIGGLEFIWKPASKSASPAVKSPARPLPPPLPKEKLIDGAYNNHSQIAEGKATELMTLVEVSDRILAGEAIEWQPSFVNSAIPDKSQVPVTGSYRRLTRDEFIAAKSRGELRDTPPLTYLLSVHGKQRLADIEARLQSQYGSLIAKDPKDGSWMLRDPLGQAQVKVQIESRPLTVLEPAAARAVYAQFAKDSLPQLTEWYFQQDAGISLQNSYSYRMLRMLGPAEDGKGGVRFGVAFEEAVRRYETETDPAKKARAGESLATFCAYLQDAPAKIQEFKLLHEAVEWNQDNEFRDSLFKA
ncbi:MAG TPA: FHA domain-containing protein, partial [bacterium]|nr:FHA domain-containing protein [bacterium]